MHAAPYHSPRSLRGDDHNPLVRAEHLSRPYFCALQAASWHDSAAPKEFLGRRKGCDAKTYHGQKELDRIANFRSVVVDSDNATLHLVVEDGRSF